MGYEVVGVDKIARPGVIQTDVTEFDKVMELFRHAKPDAVIHLAAISGSTGKNEIEQSLRQPQLNFETNVIGTVGICEACRLTGVRTVIYMSSFAVYGRTDRDRLPITPETPVSLKHAYATSKYMGELAVRTYSEDFGLKSVIFRAPFVSGEHQNEKNVLLEFIESAIQGNDLIIYGKESM
jgi:UDP-glucose 4-epimerase